MKTFQEFITERSDLPGNTGGSSNRLEMPAPKPAPGGASNNKVTLPQKGRGKSFMQSITTDGSKARATTSRAPSLNVNPNVKHSSRSATPGVNSRYGEGSVAKSHRGLI